MVVCKKDISVIGDITEDKEYYDTILTRLFKKAFNIEINPHTKKSNSVYGFYVCKKPIREFFKSLGFPVGKKTYTVSVPKRIMDTDDPKVWCAFIRGFCDGDGCLCFNTRKGKYQKILQILHTYPKISLSSVSENILQDISCLLKKIGILHGIYTSKSKKANEKDKRVLQVLGCKRLEKWMKLIGFSNPSLITRYEIFKRYGFVPVRTTIETRKKILEGLINPWIFYPIRARSSAWIEC